MEINTSQSAEAKQQNPNETVIKKINLPEIKPKGRDNRCGFFALIQALNYYRLKEQKEPINPDNINDKLITGFFTAPKTIVDYARLLGYEAKNISRASSTEEEAQDVLQKLLENDIPALIVIKPDPSKPRLLHYVTVTGFEKKGGKIINYFIMDIWRGELKWTPTELKQNWSGIAFVDGSHCMIPVTTKDKGGLLPPEKQHRGYELMESAALAGTGFDVRTTSYNDKTNISAGAFLNFEHNHHIGNNPDNGSNLEWINNFSVFAGANPDQKGASFSAETNIESFIGKVYKSPDLKNITQYGITAQSNNGLNFNETYIGPSLGFKKYGKNTEWNFEIKPGFINGQSGVMLDAEFDWAIFKKRKPMTLREWELFIKYHENFLFGGGSVNKQTQFGLRYKF